MDLGNKSENLKNFDLEAYAGMGSKATNSSKNDVTKHQETRSWDDTPSTNYNKVKDVADQLATRHIDITKGYNQWISLGFALASELGENGREIFHQLSQMNEGYNPGECDKKYDSLMKGNKPENGINIGTFFQMAKDAGVVVSANTAKLPSAKNIKNNGKKAILGGLDKEMAVGSLAEVAVGCNGYTFSDKLSIDDWPSFMKPIFDIHHDAVSRDKMILGVLNVVSGLMGGANGLEDEPSGIYGIYDGRKVYAPLFNIIYGTAGSAKGDLVFCKLLARPVKMEMRRDYEAAKAQYEEELAAYEAQNKGKKKADRGTAPKEPPFKDPFTPGNSSASAVYRALDANGGWGIMFETEADTISSMIDSDYGNYSDLLRKAYHHETVSMNRVSEKIHIDIDNPRLSTFITCTPGQLSGLFPSFENGLGSRFQFYNLPDDIVDFHDVFALNDSPLEDQYKQMGTELLPLYHAMQARKGHPIQFVMSDRQKKEFVSTYKQTLTEQFKMLGNGINPFIFRTALANFRIAMVLSALRRLSDWNKRDDIFSDDENALGCDDRDFQIAMTIEECLIYHTAHVYASMAKENENPFANKGIKLKPEEMRLYNMLPDGDFRTCDFIALAESQNISERNAYRILGQLSNVYGILTIQKRGIYRKTSISS